MEKDHEKKVKEIIVDITCSKDVKCYKQGFKSLCKAQDIGLNTLLECLEEPPNDCQFSLSYGGMFLCECPLRVYISKNLKK